MRTNHAAIGAATIPPSINENTQTQLTCSQPSEMKKPIVAASETGNSLVSTDPITFLASFPLAKSTGVVIGPQPPPPVESTNPANKPSGTSCLADIRLFEVITCF